MTRSFTRKVLLHAVCWSIFIAYELTILYMALGKIDGPYSYPVYYAIHIAYFYSVVTLLDRTFALKRYKPLAGLAFFLLLVACYLLLKAIADYFLAEQHSSAKAQLFYIQSFILRNFMRGFYFTILALFYWAAGHITFFRRQQEAAERQKLFSQIENSELRASLAVSQNAYYQQQVNPHMLFNALNFVYNNVHERSPDAARCVWLLSELMRFGLEPAGHDGKISVEAEVEQLEHLLEINRYRFNGALYIDVDIEGHLGNRRIIPLVLLTLAENVFKHGNLKRAEAPAYIGLTISDSGELLFRTRNLIKARTEEPERSSLGLANTRTRLDFAYPGKYTLDCGANGDLFELNLSIQL